MHLNDLYLGLSGLNIPVRYSHFDKPVPLPFIVYYSTGNSDVVADNVNFCEVDNVIVELYAATKNSTNESAIEKIFRDNEIVFDKSSTYLNDEKCFMIAYTIQLI